MTSLPWANFTDDEDYNCAVTNINDTISNHPCFWVWEFACEVSIAEGENISRRIQSRVVYGYTTLIVIFVFSSDCSQASSGFNGSKINEGESGEKVNKPPKFIIIR